jgi:carbamoylphosphate synthase small subunit
MEVSLSEALSANQRLRTALNTAKCELRDNGITDPGGKKFKSLKHKFSQYYHPHSQLGPKSRAMVFKDFWQVIINIERQS